MNETKLKNARSIDDVLGSGRARVIIENLTPAVDGGQFPAKRIIGDSVTVEADVFTDGHDAIAVMLLYRHSSQADWHEAPMAPLVNDRWRATFQVNQLGTYLFTVAAWIDRFASWRDGLAKKVDAGQDVSVELLAGAELVKAAAKRAKGNAKSSLTVFAKAMSDKSVEASTRARQALQRDVEERMAEYPDRRWATRYDRELTINVDRQKARHSTWYELFPRSCAAEPGKHGTFEDVIARLPYVAGMGFDVLYLPPIHPVGVSFRKGKNNALSAADDDVGSPWAIGAEEGGHKSIHAELGTLKDFRALIVKAKELNLEIAMDIAFQCTPDHPYVTEHPEWFRKRPDGTIQYAENPPKKYQDIYPIDFESEDWQALWHELKSIFDFWCDQGVRIFRVDNPHTKAFPFWQWAIAKIKQQYPDALFLAEAFTRPKVMHRLAKIGFSQSYTYFAWRNTKWELTQYFTELTQSDVKDFFRPNLWPNTPDILTEYLQFGGRPAFMARLLLAATLGASYGIYGPAFELCDNTPREPGSEEYLNSEKYELKRWDIGRSDSLKEFIAVVNRIRRDNVALQSDETLRFHATDNDEIICFSKQSLDGKNVILVVVNLDPHHTQSGWINLSLDELALAPDQPFQVHDLLTNARYLWHGAKNYVQLDPQSVPGQIFRVRHRLRREQDFDYFL